MASNRRVLDDGAVIETDTGVAVEFDSCEHGENQGVFPRGMMAADLRRCDLTVTLDTMTLKEEDEDGNEIDEQAISLNVGSANVVVSLDFNTLEEVGQFCAGILHLIGHAKVEMPATGRFVFRQPDGSTPSHVMLGCVRRDNPKDEVLH